MDDLENSYHKEDEDDDSGRAFDDFEDQKFDQEALELVPALSKVVTNVPKNCESFFAIRQFIMLKIFNLK